jgi:small redox-active disulfide protein 2
LEIKILGTGCANCNKLEKEVFNALAELGIAADVEKVEDIKVIMAYKVMSLPALVINGTVKVTGRVTRGEEIKKYLTGNK